MTETAGTTAHEHRLANDRYHLTISDDGTGSSHYSDLAITRRAPDRTRETDAFALYVRDLESGEYWSAGAEPVRWAGDAYEAIALDGLVTLVREHDGIRTTLEISLRRERSCRGAQTHDRESERPCPTPRCDDLRRARAQHAGSGRVAPGILEAVRADGVGRNLAGAACEAPLARHGR